MAFNWTPITFEDNNPATPLSAHNMNYLEQGITYAGQLASAQGDATTAYVKDASIDFDYMDRGFTICEQDTKPAHSPDDMTSVHGFLLCFDTPNYMIQFLVNMAENFGAIYTRRRVNMTWEDWTKIATNTSVHSMEMVPLSQHASAPVDVPSAVQDDAAASQTVAGEVKADE